MEAKGFTIQAVASRVQKLDSTFTWKAYTALATLARLTGNTKKAVEAKIFGRDKPSKDFNNAWSRAGHVYARFYGTKEAAATIRLLGIDDAEKAALQAINDHMTALGVNGKNAYDAVVEYGSKDEIPVASAEPEATPTEPEVETSPTGETVSLQEAGDMPDAYETVATAFNTLPGDDQLNLMLAYVDVATDEVLNVLAAAITARMVAEQQKLAA